ncbi:hypothetical protein [Runella zeae]|uniref:hypothetical protein n=1 Tax=Runella zeae TaxID=94255 RepID=UPI0003F8E5F2|nr:hypothetical protein [Runella zeae]
MLISAEQRLADTTDAYRNYREIVTPGLEKKARKKGIWIGAGGSTAIWLTLLILLK